MVYWSSQLDGTSQGREAPTTTSHPRYRRRQIALIASGVGLLLNIIAISVTTTEADLLTGLAFIPVCLSAIWNYLDIFIARKFSQYLPSALIVIVDGLGFLGFLALIIANGVVISDMFTNDAVLLAYTSMPWIINCIIHATIVFEIAWQYVNHLAMKKQRYSICPNCNHDLSSTCLNPHTYFDHTQDFRLAGDLEAAEKSKQTTTNDSNGISPERGSIDSTSADTPLISPAII